MTNRVIAGALTVLLTTSAVVSADDGAARRTAAPSTRPLWTLVGVGAGFGTGLWAGLTAFDDSINSDRKVWTSAIVGAAAGGILGYLADRQRTKSHTTPTRTSTPMLSPRDQHDVISAARRLDSFYGRVVRNEARVRRAIEDVRPAERGKTTLP